MLCCALMRADVFSIVLCLSYYFIIYGVFPFLFPSLPFISLPPLFLSFLYLSSSFLSSTFPSSPFLSLLSLPPPFLSLPLLSLPVLLIFPLSPFSFSLFSLLVLPIFPFSPFPSSLFSLSLPFCPPYSSGTLRGDPNPVAMKGFVKILFSIYRTVVLSAYFFYFILLYHV